MGVFLMVYCHFVVFLSWRESTFLLTGVGQLTGWTRLAPKTSGNAKPAGLSQGGGEGYLQK